MQKLCRLAIVACLPLILVGCTTSPGITGMERKFGRGLNNATEFVRGGEIRRSIEQSALFGEPSIAHTTGFFHGFNRSVARTFVGVYEMATAPIPNGPGNDYGPIMLPENPVYPASYKPGMIADESYATDNHIGFSGGDVAPFIPGSKFKVFDDH